MKKIFVLFFTSLLVAFIAIGCGGGGSDGGSSEGNKVDVPGAGSLSTKSRNPKTGNASETGLKSETGCKDTNGDLPGCPK